MNLNLGMNLKVHIKWFILIASSNIKEIFVVFFYIRAKWSFPQTTSSTNVIMVTMETFRSRCHENAKFRNKLKFKNIASQPLFSMVKSNFGYQRSSSHKYQSVSVRSDLNQKLCSIFENSAHLIFFWKTIVDKHLCNKKDNSCIELQDNNDLFLTGSHHNALCLSFFQYQSTAVQTNRTMYFRSPFLINLVFRSTAEQHDSGNHNTDYSWQNTRGTCVCASIHMIDHNCFTFFFF